MIHFVSRSATLILSAVLLTISGPLAAAADAPVPVQAPATALDVAQASVTPFPDVPENHWAYDAITQLTQDGYIKGYPSGKFSGNRPMTRYEVAFLVNQAVSALQDKVAAGAVAERTDVDALKKLMTAFGPEVADLRTRVSRLETQVGSLQQQTDALKNQAASTAALAAATADSLRSAHVGFRFFSRPGTMSYNMSIINGPVPIAAVAGVHPAIGAGQQIVGFSGPGGPYYASAGNLATGVAGDNYGSNFAYGGTGGQINSLPTGIIAHGVNLNYGSIYLSGSLGTAFNYGARLSSALKTELATTGLSSASPSYCTVEGGSTNPTGPASQTGAGCSYGDLANTSSSIATSLDLLWAGWRSPSGFYGQLGRFTLNAGEFNDNPLEFGGNSTTGATFGWADPQHRGNFWFAYSPPPVSAMTLATANAGVTGNVCTPTVYGLNAGAVPSQAPGVNGYCNQNEQQFLSSGSWFFSPQHLRTAIGYEYWYHGYQPETFWDAAAVTCNGSIAINAQACASSGFGAGSVPGAFISAQGNDTQASFFLSQFFGRSGIKSPAYDLGTFNVLLEYTQHFGNDPFTGTQNATGGFAGAPWVGAGSFQATLTYASKGNLNGYAPAATIATYGTANSNVAQFFFVQSGLGSGTSAWTTNGSVIPQNNLPITDTAGTQNEGLQFDHWFSDSVRVGLTALHVQNIPGVALPAGVLLPGANPVCGACYVKNLNINELYLDTWLYRL